MPTLHWRKAEPSDLPEISEIASRIHPDLPEGSDVLAEKMRLCPDGCLVLVANDAIVGYGLSHPWMRHQIPRLDELLHALPSAADCLYVHDVAVLPAFRGRQAADSYIERIIALARSVRITALALVSVYDTPFFWERFGFRVVAGDATLRAKLASYGETARYMMCDLAPTQEPGT
jgi:ribosomal protein S18 acetylase RimI-like enzyme